MRYVGICSTKGGVAKTTTAIHLAYWLALKGHRVVLVDNDANRSALKWLARAEENSKFTVPFKVVTFAKMAKAIAGADVIVLDTQASITVGELKDLAEDCELLVIPTKTDIDSAAAATETAESVVEYGGNYRLLITDAPTGSSKSGVELQVDLLEAGYKVLDARIRRGEGVRHASLTGATLAQQRGAYRLPWLDYEAAFQEIYDLLEDE